MIAVDLTVFFFLSQAVRRFDILVFRGPQKHFAAKVFLFSNSALCFGVLCFHFRESTNVWEK